MKKIKIRKYKKTRIAFIILFIIVIMIGISRVFNKFMEPSLQALARQHAGFAINNIVKEVLNDMDYESSSLYTIQKNADEEITNIEFDSYKLNQLLYSSLNTIDKSLEAAQDGKADPVTKAIFYSDGVVYQIPMGYLTHIFFLYDKGPNLNVRIKMMNDVTGQIKTEVKPYGVNSSVLQISLVINVDAQVITYLTASSIRNTSEIPLVIQVINGKVPQISPYVNSKKDA